MATDEELIGRPDVNDIDGILAITNTDVGRRRPRGGGQLRHPLHLGLRQGGPAQAEPLVREGQDVAVERRDRPGVGHAGRPGGGGHGQRRPRRAARCGHRPERHLPAPLVGQGVAPVRRREPELDAVAVPPRRAGRPALHGQDRRDVPWIDAKYYAATQVMDEARHVEVFAQVPRHQALGPLPDQRPPAAAARRHHRRQPLGHDLPRHADHGRGPGPGCLRLHPHADDRAAAEAAAALRHVRRGPPRGVRGALPAGATTPS